jgi:hypothetical protein
LTKQLLVDKNTPHLKKTFWRKIQMKKIILAIAFALSSTAFANTDLVLEGERWFGKWTAYVCDDGYTQATEVPAELAEYNVQFGHVGTTYNLNRFLIKATFEENGTKCSYSSFLDGDKTAWTIALDYSQAVATEGEGSCEQGKALVDQILAFNKYKYLHGRAAIYFDFSNSATACAGESKIGLHFQVQGRHR